MAKSASAFEVVEIRVWSIIVKGSISEVRNLNGEISFADKGNFDTLALLVKCLAISLLAYLGLRLVSPSRFLVST